MKKLNINGSILMDAYIAFTCMLIMCSVFLPMLLQLNHTFNDKIENISMKRIILLGLKYNDSEHLINGVNIDGYKIKLTNSNLCIKTKDINNEKCFHKYIFQLYLHRSIIYIIYNYINIYYATSI